MLTPVLARYIGGIFAASLSVAVLACSLPFLLLQPLPCCILSQCISLLKRIVVSAYSKQSCNMGHNCFYIDHFTALVTPANFKPSPSLTQKVAPYSSLSGSCKKHTAKVTGALMLRGPSFPPYVLHHKLLKQSCHLEGRSIADDLITWL